MRPEDTPSSISADELKALAAPGEESLGPTGRTFPRSVSPSEAAAIFAADPLTEQVNDLLAPGGVGPAAHVPGPVGTGHPSSATDLERSILGEMAEPGTRRAVDDLATRVRQAVAAGASDASRYEAGRVPQVEGEVIFRGAPARVLDVLDGGNPMSRLDLLQYRGGRPEALAAVEHDRDHGWHWLGEPPPPEPTGEDRVRQALASGKPAVPKVGEVVRLLRAKPRSYLGVQLVGLRARVVEQVDVVGDRVILDLEVLDELVDGLDPAMASGVIRGVVGPVEFKEGWARVAPNRPMLPDTRGFDARPCERCGVKIPPKGFVQFLARTYEHYTQPVLFAQLCPTCADQWGRLAFVKPASANPTDDLEDLEDLA